LLIFIFIQKGFLLLFALMFKTVSGLLLISCLYFAMPALAQKADSLKKADSLRVDTNLLNRYRIEPRRNALPMRVRPAMVHEELIPLSMLDYKVNYWRKWITFGININQSAFSNNWSAGGVSSLAVGGNFDYKTEYNKAPFDYVGELLMLYGRVTNKGQIARKTNDRLFFDNKIATQLSKRWFLFGSVTFESQFSKGYQYTDGGGLALATPCLPFRALWHRGMLRNHLVLSISLISFLICGLVPVPPAKLL
jgi:hypothetical protein